MEGLILDAAQPPPPTVEREALARESFRAAIGDTTGGALHDRLVNLARSKDPEVRAVLNTPYARTVAESRGLVGDDLTKAFTAVRRLSAATSATAGTTMTQILAGKSLESFDRLRSANGAITGFGAQAVR